VWGRTLLVAVAVLATAPAGSSGTDEAGPTGRIAYAPRVYPKDQRIGDNWEIYTVDAAGGRSLNLTRHACSEHSPAWAHDGYRIAFVCHNDLIVMHRDTRARRTVLRGRQLEDLAWAPDDRQLAFAGHMGIRVVNGDGTGLRQLSRGRDTSPTWSRDGQTVAFSREVPGEVFHVFRMRADGRGQRRIVANADSPAFSPDGRTIAFLRSGWIWLMDADGGRQRRLKRAGDGNVDLAWSSDGRYLVYQYQHSELYVIRRDGTGRRRLPSYGADFSGLDWGPNLPS
jgi:Tol biopolymer transport system component